MHREIDLFVNACWDSGSSHSAFFLFLKTICKVVILPITLLYPTRDILYGPVREWAIAECRVGSQEEEGWGHLKTATKEISAIARDLLDGPILYTVSLGPAAEESASSYSLLSYVCIATLRWLLYPKGKIK